MGRLSYLRRCIAAQISNDRFKCPNCGSSQSSVVDRKYFVTQLRRCSACMLLFRTPTDDPLSNERFYESEYAQGFTTDLPSEEDLDSLKRRNFSGTEKDYSYYISVLTQLGLKPGAKLFDFGCSWGYGSYQLAKAGFEVAAFEIAPTRRRFAETKLGVRTVTDMSRTLIDFAGQFDCFFSAHVMEHVPSPAHMLACAKELLKTNGLFVSFTPNGSNDCRSAFPDWSKLWGEVHPNFIDDMFLDRSFSRSPRCVGSSPVTNASVPSDEGNRLIRLNALSGAELFFAARKNGEPWCEAYNLCQT